MNKFIKIGNLYYNLDRIENIGFKTIENSLTNEKVAYYIIINNSTIYVDEKQYYNLLEYCNKNLEVVL